MGGNIPARFVPMKLSKSLLQAMVVAVTITTVSAAEKPAADNAKEASGEPVKPPKNPDGCPGCGMG
jgi:hypothetical protein